MKKTITLTTLFCLFSLIAFSQKEKSTSMGRGTLDELKMKVYAKDTTAAAVVLYEQKNIYMDAANNYDIRTDYYFRIKIFDKNAFDLSRITISLYGKKKAVAVKGITYNLTETGSFHKTYLEEKDIFTEQYNDDFTLKKFSLPNVKEGSIIEYTYSTLSPYFGLNDWYFQSNIPKIKSELDYALIANYEYNIRLVGLKKLDKNKVYIKKKCIDIDGFGLVDCVAYSFGMNDVPAFKEEEFMLSKKNYLSRISFDMKSFVHVNGGKSKYTTTWKDADKRLKKYFFNNQTSKKSFFKRQLPKSIFAIENDLDKAKKIFYFIQNHFVWNGDNWTNEDVAVKEAFENKSGSVGEINLSLYNSLLEADLEASLVVLSTRDHIVPTKIFPVIFDFNYVIVQLKINEQTYYLDATSGFLPFGELPSRTLNGEARLINFKNEGTWISLKPKNKTYRKSSAKLTLNEAGELTGVLNIVNAGYYASNVRNRLHNSSKEKYLEAFETKHPDVEVNNYKITHKEDLNKPISETFEVTLYTDKNLGKIARINPIFFGKINENPFKLKERFFPVDFAYARKSMYNLSLKIPDNYKVTNIPETKAFALPNNGGNFTIKCTHRGDTIFLFVRFSLHKSTYSSQEYFYLKEFYKQVIQAESSYITLEKKA